ncbi:UDP-galactopyranose mutase [Helicobacter sp. WB40]|uniref:UDP-galactopyranose mutase n=1 Tax=Helicobacter sp. WB40 TaxID=3004130 RepID=UPI0022EC02B1|nr:UDP-galactopyranose mutase [Helicobacter sp. WB40]MDA3967547.1 NAD(P)-binding protein [Helicobacter sp. WB40]
MKKALVVGGGFAGCVIAHFLKNKNFKVEILEGSNVLGGGCRTFFYHGHPYTYGPHHLLVDVGNTSVIDFFNQFLNMREIKHYMLTFVASDREFYSYPPHIDDIALMPDRDKIQKELERRDPNFKASNFEDFWINAIGKTLYDKFINFYSQKMWKIKNNKEIDVFGFFGIDSAIQTGSKQRFVGKKDVLYPKELDGYNSLFEKCVEGCDVRFNTYVDKFELDKKRVYVNGEYLSADVIINTSSLDMVFDYCYGELRYIGRDFQKIILPVKYALPELYHFAHYADSEESYTRIVEYKKLTGYESKYTMIGIETPSFNNKLYPYQTSADVAKYKKYLELMPNDCYTLGRMGRYRYSDMSEILNDCLELIKEI